MSMNESGAETRTESIPWDWSKADNANWLSPAPEVYFLAERWRSRGFRRMLDLGCGLGRHSVFFAKAGFDVDAFDLSGEGIAFLERTTTGKNLPVMTRKGDMLDLPYDNCSFDCLLAFNSIYHADSAGMGKALEEIRRVLKPGAEFYITFVSMKSAEDDDTLSWIDARTGLRDEGGRTGIPHCFVDDGYVMEIMDGFELDRVLHSGEFSFEGSRIKWHYHVSGRKPHDLDPSKEC